MKKIDPKVFLGVCMGLGGVGGSVIKMAMVFQDGTSPFWLWAVVGLCLFFSAALLWNAHRERAALKARIERAGRAAGESRSRREAFEDGGARMDSLEAREQR